MRIKRDIGTHEWCKLHYLRLIRREMEGAVPKVMVELPTLGLPGRTWRPAVEEVVALLRVSAAIISAPGLCRTSSWTSWDAASHQSSRREPLMIGSVALPNVYGCYCGPVVAED